MADHAILSASSSHKWLRCPPSARLEEQLPDTTSEYAAEGTLAHALGELRLRKRFTMMKKSAYYKALKALKANPLFSPEMEGSVEVYVDHIVRTARAFPTHPTVAIEKRLDYSAWAPEGFGTGDCILLHGSVLHINDFKYGRGVPVEAQNNPQMMLYALGAYRLYALLYGIQTVRMTIVQPRLDSVSTAEMSVADLLAWGESIKPAARLAWEGRGEFAAGDHCRFCRARATCRARMDHFASLEKWGRAVPPLISSAEVGQALEWGEGLAQWLKDLQDFALNECLSGHEIQGWKAVEGRGVRTLDADRAIPALIAAGYQEALFYERRPLAMGAIEKILGKQKGLIAPYATKPPGKPALVPMSDKREPYSPRTTAEQDFACN